MSKPQALVNKKTVETILRGLIIQNPTTMLAWTVNKKIREGAASLGIIIEE
jgi:hypothetical protein